MPVLAGATSGCVELIDETLSKTKKSEL